jgi:hypothetical protein
LSAEAVPAKNPTASARTRTIINFDLIHSPP